MPNPRQHTYMLPHAAAQKANAQIMAMTDYLARFTTRLEELHVAPTDPLYAGAVAARAALIDLGIAIVDSSKPPGKTKWE